MTAYYNEIDKIAAHWLRNLIEAGHIAPGYVDERSIEDVYPSDLRGFTQCHFFAGIGVWSHALRSSGWADDRPVWSGSCPCQPFSAAGKGAGFDDERHLWPAFHHLIKECNPAIVFGEQVASKAVEPWIDLVHTDLEALGYAFGCVPFPSAGVGAPHIRDRAYWVAHAADQRRIGRRAVGPRDGRDAPWVKSERLCNAVGMEHAAGSGRGQGGLPTTRCVSADGQWSNHQHCDAGEAFGLADTGSYADRRQAEPAHHIGMEIDGPADQSGRCSSSFGGMADSNMQHQGPTNDAPGPGDAGRSGEIDRPGPTNGYWQDADWLGCRDDKWRPVEPGTFPLVNGAPARVGRLRGYGNAINAKAAQAFIESVMEAA